MLGLQDEQARGRNPPSKESDARAAAAVDSTTQKRIDIAQLEAVAAHLAEFVPLFTLA